MGRREGRGRPRQSRNGEGGFTLLECAIAMVILSGALMAGLELLDSHKMNGDRQYLESHAARFLNRELEWAAVLPIDSLASHGWRVLSEDARFEIASEVTDPSSSMREVLVSIRWTTPSGNVRIESATRTRYRGPE